MVTTTEVEFGYSSVVYRQEIPAVPTTTQRDGNVTINNIGTPGVPASFEVTSMITADHEAGDVKFHNIFHWKVVLVGLPKDAPYSEVDAEAARRLAPMLRDVADLIEQQVKAYDERSKADS